MIGVERTRHSGAGILMATFWKRGKILVFSQRVQLDKRSYSAHFFSQKVILNKKNNFDTQVKHITMSLNAKIGKYCSRRRFNCTKLTGSDNNQNSSSTSPLKRKTSLFSASNKASTLKKIDTTCGGKDFIEEDSGFCEDFSNNNSVGKFSGFFNRANLQLLSSWSSTQANCI